MVGYNVTLFMRGLLPNAVTTNYMWYGMCIKNRIKELANSTMWANKWNTKKKNNNRQQDSIWIQMHSRILNELPRIGSNDRNKWIDNNNQKNEKKKRKIIISRKYYMFISYIQITYEIRSLRNFCNANYHFLYMSIYNKRFKKITNTMRVCVCVWKLSHK